LKRILPKLFFWIPAIAWITIVLLESILIRIHELFYLVIGTLPLISVFVFIYFAAIYTVKRTKRNKLLFLTILVVCLVKYTDHLISFGASSPENAIELKVLTWNVQRLGALSKNENPTNNLKQLSLILNSSKADVAVLQEISKNQTSQLLDYLGLKDENSQWTSYKRKTTGGIAVVLLGNNDWSMSIKNVTNLPSLWKCVYTEIKHITGQKINVLGVHIVPPEVGIDDAARATGNFLSGRRAGITKILKTYVGQAKMQTRQIGTINNLVRKFNDPSIIAGDFNSTCQLPIHKELRDNLNDTWLEGGTGIGATRYWAGILPFRIDYIYATNDFQIITTNIGKAEFSDHSPVMSHLFLEQ
tara:strand:- start:254 stop:1327 length:1074 start_codon:yes stop_codon:yes gene_type:complete